MAIRLLNPARLEEVRTFWEDAARRVKAYHEAPSTQLYFEQEKNLVQEFFAPLSNLLFLKTDLWNEAKNTQLLWWFQSQGGKAVGIDISQAVLREAREKRLGGADEAWLLLADVRELPFLDNSFSGIYSMGTIEHFAETELAISELYRVLKPGGKAIIGVPNKHDLFLRPLHVFILSKLGLYAFGQEKSFSRIQLRSMLEKAGFKVKMEGSLLFLPGLLRMVDLYCYHHAPFFLPWTKLMLKSFVFLYNLVDFFRKRGYLLAMGVEK